MLNRKAKAESNLVKDSPHYYAKNNNLELKDKYNLPRVSKFNIITLLEQKNMANKDDKVKNISEIKILFGEDDFINRHITSEHIKKHGFNVISFETGKGVVKAIASEKPDLIIMDCYMPEMTGYEAAEHINKQKKDKLIDQDIPVIAISGDTTKQNKDKVKAAGFDDLIEKPLDDDKFAKIVKKWLNIDLNKGKDVSNTSAKEVEKNLKQDFYKRLESYLEELPGFLKDPNNFNKEKLEEFSKTIHNCIGTPGMFGFHEISNLAISLNEELLNVIAKDEEEISENDINKLGNLTSILVEEISNIIAKKSNLKTQLFSDHSNIGKDKNILVVDDDKLILDVLTKKLSNHGFQIFTAGSGTEAIEQVSKEDIDLIILDYKLPEIDGYEVLENLNKETSAANIPVIVITAMQDKRNMIKGMSLGIADFVTKPFDADEMVERVIKIVVGNKIRILAIDDDELILSLIKDRLDSNGFSVETTLESENAISLAEDLKPDVIILDRMMPNLDGDSVLKLLKSNPKTKDMPVIFLTAMSEKGEILESYKEGVEGYIVKPFKVKDLTDQIFKILNS